MPLSCSSPAAFNEPAAARRRHFGAANVRLARIVWYGVMRRYCKRRGKSALPSGSRGGRTRPAKPHRVSRAARLPGGQITTFQRPCPLCLSSPPEKIFCFTEYSDYPISLPSRPTIGAFRNVIQRGAGCGGRGCAFDEWRRPRTAKPCGPGTSTLVSSWREAAPVTVAKEPEHRGDHGVSRKPLRGECRVIPV